jgi:hypothetical protein
MYEVAMPFSILEKVRKKKKRGERKKKKVKVRMMAWNLLRRVKGRMRAWNFTLKGEREDEGLEFC